MGLDHHPMSGPLRPVHALVGVRAYQGPASAQFGRTAVREARLGFRGGHAAPAAMGGPFPPAKPRSSGSSSRKEASPRVWGPQPPTAITRAIRGEDRPAQRRAFPNRSVFGALAHGR
jgi:hypothetical protein